VEINHWEFCQVSVDGLFLNNISKLDLDIFSNAKTNLWAIALTM
jgi:hypothetical protein